MTFFNSEDKLRCLDGAFQRERGLGGKPLSSQAQQTNRSQDSPQFLPEVGGREEQEGPHPKAPQPLQPAQAHQGVSGGAPRPDPASIAVPLPQGLSTCQQMQAALYLECSAKFRENVEDVFREAAKVALSALKKAQRQKQPRLCLLL